MTDYTNTYGGAAKDAGKDIILGTELDTQFDAVAAASATKADKAGSTFTGIYDGNDTTDSTSGGTGSIHTDGGIGAVKNIVSDANIKAKGVTDSTSGTTGALQSAGGIGAVKDIISDANIKAKGTTDSTSGITGALQSAGGIGAVKDIVTDANFKPLGDTAAADAAAMGYTAAEGLVLTGQGSVSDVTLKNDADGTVLTIPTGTTNVVVVGALTAGGGIDKLTNATGVVSVAAATAPSTGQVLQATSSTVATWQTVVENATHTGDVTGSVALTIAAKAVDVAMLADGTDGELITWGADAVATTVAAGSSAQVLTSNGAGAAPTFQALAGGIWTLDGENSMFAGTGAGAALETNGTDNFFAGNNAGNSTTTGKDNIVIGEAALRDSQTKNGNIAIGKDVLQTLTTGSGYNTAIGYQAMQNADSAEHNVAIGFQALFQEATGHRNVCIGYLSGFNFRLGSSGNISLGQDAGPSTNTGFSNELYIHNSRTDTPLIHGDFSALTLTINGQLFSTGGIDKLTTATGVVSVAAATAPSTGQVLTATSSTVATWQTPGGAFTEDPTNNSIYSAGAGAALAAGGTFNFLALDGAGAALTTADHCIMIGENAGNDCTDSVSNIVLGGNSFVKNTTKSNNIIIGVASLALSTGNGDHLWIGNASGIAHTTGSDNHVIGHGGFNAISTGSNNVGLGFQVGSGFNTTSSGNVALGYRAGPNTTAVYNDELYIHNEKTNTPLIWGDFSGDVVVINGQLWTTSNNTTLTPVVGADEFVVEGDAANGMSLLCATSGVNQIAFGDSNDTDDGIIKFDHSAGEMQFWNNGIEAITIDNGGRVFCLDGLDAAQDTDGNYIFTTRNTASTTPEGMHMDFTAASPDNNTQVFALFEDSTTPRCYIYSDGDLVNHDGVYGTISDRRLKDDFKPARSYWDDFKRLDYQTYTMKSDGKHASRRLGLVHDEVEKIFPALAPIDGETEMGFVKSSIIEGVIAATVLQEAVARIETLEATVATLLKQLGKGA